MVAASGAVDGNGQQIPEAANKTTWHVNGKIVLHGPVDVPDKPDPVADVEGVYNGEPYTLTAPDVEGFSLKYQIQDPASGTWTDSVIPPSRTSADVTNVKVIYTYNKPSGDKNDYNDIVYEAKIDVQKRPLTLTVDDQEKFEGEQDPSFTYKITSTGENEGLVNGHQLSNVMLSKEQNSTTGEWEIKILSWEITEKVGDDEHDRKNNYDVTVIPGTLTVKQNELPQEWRPTVKSTIAIYDGTPHNLQIEYKSEAPARYFDVKYEVLVQENGVGSWKELAPYTVAEQTDVGALQVRVTSPSKGRLLMPPMLWSRI